MMTDKEKMDRVESVVAALGLQGCRDTWIGDTQTRGISGGERTRVSIGIELVTNPQILFLDEVLIFKLSQHLVLTHSLL
jgi:ABC-type multidrug transport system ATPase subunit